jgi:hypothetical protein
LLTPLESLRWANGETDPVRGAPRAQGGRPDGNTAAEALTAPNARLRTRARLTRRECRDRWSGNLNGSAIDFCFLKLDVSILKDFPDKSKVLPLITRGLGRVESRRSDQRHHAGAPGATRPKEQLAGRQAGIHFTCPRARVRTGDARAPRGARAGAPRTWDSWATSSAGYSPTKPFRLVRAVGLVVLSR